ncbi:MAG: hypothetical protein JNN27_18030 [Planctomycetes bacterium]|nr:hypothetical protein [Planctomycetota bacterium]
MRHHLLAALSVVSVAASARAQSGGFAPGDLYFFTTALTAPSEPFHKPLMRIDPISGAATVITDWPQAHFPDGGVVYDPFRDRIVMMGHPTQNAPTPLRLYLVDAGGGWTDLGFPSRGLHAFAPARGGRIYMLDSAQLVSGPKLRYLDATNQEHVVLDASGSTHYVIPNVGAVRWMLYDDATNALFTAHQSTPGAGCGSSISVFVQKHPLSSDGSRVSGAVTCGSFLVSQSGSDPVGFSRGPNGLQITVDTNSNNVEPHVLDVDTATLAITPYATFGYPGSGGIGAGSYSHLRGEAIVFDNFTNSLRAFGPGSSGGAILPVPLHLSPVGSSGEHATLFEIPAGACGTNNVTLYCTAKTSSSGCVPTLSTLGGPSASAGSGFTIYGSQVESAKAGLFFYGTSGPASAPFQGGFLCVQPPSTRTPIQNSGGAAACSGVFAFDFNAWAASGVDPALVSGAAVHGQFWYRDGQHPIAGTGFSAGIAFTLCN